MNPKFTLVAAVLAATMSLAGAAFAGPNDYTFEPVNADVKKGNGVTVAVRLVHKLTGKPVSDAVIFSPRIDMSPEGMETMTAPITLAAGAESGSYAFKTDLPMAGGWLLTVSVKVQGEAETVIGKVTFKATD
jgi:hypothetical protein